MPKMTWGPVDVRDSTPVEEKMDELMGACLAVPQLDPDGGEGAGDEYVEDLQEHAELCRTLALELEQRVRLSQVGSVCRRQG